jgi:dTDP-L-rhamnose 4-epimerase
MIDGEPPAIFSDGEQMRDFISVDAAVCANLVAADSDDAAGNRLNISGRGAVTIYELARILQGYIPNAPAPIYRPARDGDI